jgi:hypothetical protein
MQGNHNNSSLAIVDWEGSDKYCFFSFSQIKRVLQGVKPQENTTTHSIITLANTENTEEVNNNNETIGRLVKTVNLTSYYSNNSVVDVIPFAVNYHNHRYSKRTSINVIGGV